MYAEQTAARQCLNTRQTGSNGDITSTLQVESTSVFVCVVFFSARLRKLERTEDVQQLPPESITAENVCGANEKQFPVTSTIFLCRRVYVYGRTRLWGCHGVKEVGTWTVQLPSERRRAKCAMYCSKQKKKQYSDAGMVTSSHISG